MKSIYTLQNVCFCQSRDKIKSIKEKKISEKPVKIKEKKSPRNPLKEITGEIERPQV